MNATRLPRTQFNYRRRAHISRVLRLLPLLALLLASFISAAAQAKRSGEGRARKQSSSASTNRDSKLKRQRATQARQRAEALAALREAADAAPQIEDRFRQAETLASIADLTCKFDEANARALLMRAWEVAASADREGQGDAQDFSSSTPQELAMQAETTEARDTVLLVAVRCDAQLADKFLRERTAEVERQTEKQAPPQQQTPSSTARRSPWGELSFGAQNRLRLARTFLEQVDARNASVVAAPVIGENIAAETIEFLISLRRADASLADNLFLQLLANQRQRIGATNANDVLLASAYIISPTLFIVVDSSGSLQIRHIQGAARQPVTASPSLMPVEVRRAFADLASVVLLRAPAVATDTASASSEAAQFFFALERLLPFFAKENSPLLPSLRARRDALATRLETTRREQLGRASEERTTERPRTDDPLRMSREQLRSLPEGAARDRVRLRIVRTAARHRRWADARIAAAAITDLSLKSRAETSIRVAQIANLVSSYADETSDDYARAARFVLESDVPPVWQAWGYAQAAQLAHRRGKHQQADDLLDQAIARAESISVNTNERIAAFIILTLTAREIALTRAPLLLAEVVRAINARDDFSGEVELLDLPLATNQSETEEDDLPIITFTLDELFASIAEKNFDKALAEARNITAPLPRIDALLGVARATLTVNAPQRID